MKILPSCVRLFLMPLSVFGIVMLITGCAPQPKAVKIDAPKLAFALMFVGVCAVCCSSIGGFSLVRAAKYRRRD